MSYKVRFPVVVVAVFAAVLGAAPAARASNMSWIFHDEGPNLPMRLELLAGTDVTGGANCPSDSILGVGAASCFFSYSRVDLSVSHIYLANGNAPNVGTDVLNLLDPYVTTPIVDLGKVSDRLYTGINPDNSNFEIYFFSAGSNQQCFLTDCFGFPQLPELIKSGVPQFAATVVWDDVTGLEQARDTFFFISELDPTPVPEPASLLLIGSGLVAVGAQLRRRKKNQ